MNTWKRWWMKFYVSDVSMPACFVPFLCTLLRWTQINQHTMTVRFGQPYTHYAISTKDCVINQTKSRLPSYSVVGQVSDDMCSTITWFSCQGNDVTIKQQITRRGIKHIFTFGHCKSVPVDKDSASSIENKE
jgi:hypothetical protein